MKLLRDGEDSRKDKGRWSKGKGEGRKERKGRQKIGDGPSVGSRRGSDFGGVLLLPQDRGRGWPDRVQVGRRQN